MNDFDLEQARIRAAHPSTRTLILLGSIALVGSFLLCVLAYILAAMAPLGIHTHPPRGWFVLAYLIAVLMGLIGGYTWGYTSRARSAVRHWLRISCAGAVYAAFSFSATAWAIPAISTLNAPHTITQTLTVVGTSDVARARTGCHTRAYFGTLAAPRGNICMDQISRHVRKGWRLHLEGHGNGWATRMTAFNGMAAQ